MKEVLQFISNNEMRYLDELFEFLKIQSISSVPEHKPDIEKCALWVIDALKKAGIDDVRLYPTPGHPIVFGQWLEAGDQAPTVLIYGHYDVQPVDPLELWDTPPFEPQIRNGKIYARGSADDKGQMYIHIKAAEAFLANQGKLPVNLKFIFEGEEEAGSSNLDDFIKNNADLLKCDTVVISDTEWLAEGLPSICYALRGICFVEITLTGPNRDLHSGSYGGAVDNPANVLAWLISQLHDKYGRITIPGFYDDVKVLTEDEHKGFLELPYNESEYCKDLDVKNLTGEIGYTTYERTWVRPSLDINGIWGGYTGIGAKTIIPSKASAKISMRLVPNQKSEVISKKVE